MNPPAMLTQELIQKIMIHFVLGALHPTPITKYQNSALLLSHLSQVWRTTAFKTPAIWSLICIVDTNGEIGEALQQVLPIYLARSQSTPLTLRLSLTEKILDHDSLSMLRVHTSRIGTLEVTAHILSRMVEKGVVAGRLSSLRSANIQLSDYFPEETMADPDHHPYPFSTILSTGHQLQDLDIDFELPRIGPPTMPIYAHLVHLQIQVDNIRTLSPYLQRLTALQSLRINHTSYEDPVQRPPWGLVDHHPTGPLLFPSSLQLLDLRIGLQDEDGPTDDFLKHAILPSDLRELRIHPAVGSTFNIQWTPSLFQSMVSHSYLRGLTILRLRRVGTDWLTLSSAIATLPLAHLEIWAPIAMEEESMYPSLTPAIHGLVATKDRIPFPFLTTIVLVDIEGITEESLVAMVHSRQAHAPVRLLGFTPGEHEELLQQSTVQRLASLIGSCTRNGEEDTVSQDDDFVFDVEDVGDVLYIFRASQ